MKEQRACFTGHRNIAKHLEKQIKIKTKEAIFSLIQRGVSFYFNGGARGFDLIAAQCVIELRNEYSQIKLFMALPFKEQAKKWSPKDIALYHSILDLADRVEYLSNEHYGRCMLDRNDYMVKNSKHCVAYMIRNYGGTAYTVKKSKENGSAVYNIAEALEV